MRPSNQPRRRRGEADAIPFDPIAMGLVVWFALAVGIAGLVCVAQDATHSLAVAELSAASP